MTPLKTLPQAELEALYRGPMGDWLPTGRQLGTFIRFLETGGARAPTARAIDSAMFVWTRFGLDFGQARWWFVTPRLTIGHFRLERGPSRWREAEVLKVIYDVSRLPIRGYLYDELKPLPDGRLLGMAGINAEAGEGEHFFFELTQLY